MQALLVVGIMLSLPAFAQRVPDQLWTELENSPERGSQPLRFDTFANLAEHLSPAVVNIEVQITRRNAWGAQGQGAGQGTGFFIHEDGYLITNAHVIDNASVIRVTTKAGITYVAEIVGVDVATDLALLKIEADITFPVAPLGSSSDARPGEWVIAIGNPYGLTQTVTAGIISALGRRELARGGGYANFIQTDAPINFGNSGGPLINVNGEVVGVNTAIRTGNDIGFAIPSDMVKVLLPQLARGEVQRAWLGVQLEPVSAETMRNYGLDRPRGALISNVVPGSPAADAGLQTGDLVVTFDDEEIDDVQHLRWLAASAEIGASIAVSLIRNQASQSVVVLMGARNDMATTTPPASGGTIEQTPTPGQNQPAPTVQALGVSVGLVNGSPTVVEVERSSLAYRMGVREGDILVRLNREQIGTVEDFRRVAQALNRGSVVEFLLRRQQSMVQVTFRLQ